MENEGKSSEAMIEFYRDRIFETVGEINDLAYIEFLLTLLMAFKKKWGI